MIKVELPITTNSQRETYNKISKSLTNISDRSQIKTEQECITKDVSLDQGKQDGLTS